MIACRQPYPSEDLWTGDFYTFGTTVDYDTGTDQPANSTQVGVTFEENGHWTDQNTWNTDYGTSTASRLYDMSHSYTGKTQGTSGDASGASGSQEDHITEYTSAWAWHSTRYVTAWNFATDYHYPLASGSIPDPGGGWGSGEASYWAQNDTYFDTGLTSIETTITFQTGTTWYESDTMTVSTSTDGWTSTYWGFTTDYASNADGTSTGGHFLTYSYSQSQSGFGGPPLGWDSETTVTTWYSFEAVATTDTTTTVTALTGAFITSAIGTLTLTYPTTTNTTITADSYTTNRISSIYTAKRWSDSKLGDSPTPSYYQTVFVREFDLFHDDWMWSGFNFFDGLPEVFVFTDLFTAADDADITALPVFTSYTSSFQILDSEFEMDLSTYVGTTVSFSQTTTTTTQWTSDTREDTLTIYDTYDNTLPLASYTEAFTRTENIRTEVTTDSFGWYGSYIETVVITIDHVWSHIDSDGTSMEDAYREKTLWSILTSTGAVQVPQQLFAFVPSYLQGFQTVSKLSDTDIPARGIGAVIPMPFPNYFLGAFIGSTGDDLQSYAEGVSVPFLTPPYNVATFETADSSWTLTFDTTGSAVFTAKWSRSDHASNSFTNSFIPIGGDCETMTMREVRFPVVIGGKPFATGPADGGASIFVWGFFQTFDSNGSGYEYFTNHDSFTMDTTDLNLFSGRYASSTFTFSGSTYVEDVLVEALTKHVENHYA